MLWLILGGWGIAAAFFIFGWTIRERMISSLYDGTVVIMKYPDGKIVYTLEFDKNPEGWQYKKAVLMEIVTEDSIRD